MLDQFTVSMLCFPLWMQDLVESQTNYHVIPEMFKWNIWYIYLHAKSWYLVCISHSFCWHCLLETILLLHYHYTQQSIRCVSKYHCRSQYLMDYCIYFNFQQYRYIYTSNLLDYGCLLLKLQLMPTLLIQRNANERHMITSPEPAIVKMIINR